eukprot:2817847-Prymnesium_polylepis.1
MQRRLELRLIFPPHVLGCGAELVRDGEDTQLGVMVRVAGSAVSLFVEAALAHVMQGRVLQVLEAGVARGVARGVACKLQCCISRLPMNAVADGQIRQLVFSVHRIWTRLVRRLQGAADARVLSQPARSITIDVDSCG